MKRNGDWRKQYRRIDVDENQRRRLNLDLIESVLSIVKNGNRFDVGLNACADLLVA
ncbi:MAG TPA: hypothetical protein PKD55_23930 [Bellilinea sp.]|nr:hypothetical protein [Bellilinea sp.]